MAEVKEIVRDVPEGLQTGLRNYWYPVLQSHELLDKPVAIRYLGEDLVVWRDGSGRAHVFPDYCPHRTTRLSIGSVVGDALQCIFHGLRFDGSGRCVFVPWEPPDRPAPTTLGARSYPVEEVRGLIFAYLGDEQQFPPPPAREELPAELWDDDYVGYVMTEMWDANWLLAQDGADQFHVPILHAQSTAETNNGAPQEVPRAAGYGDDDRRMRVSGDSRVLMVDAVGADGNPIFTGQRAEADYEAEGFHLPALLCLSIQARRDSRPYHINLWMFPIDEHHTRVTRYISRRATTPAEREEWDRFYHEVVYPRTLQVSAEDHRVAAAQRGLLFSRTHERIFAPDREIYARRLLLRDAFLAQSKGERLAPELRGSRRAP